ncbi:DUF4942 domain-containing protein [Billgrantia azerbaijanica]|nr:DUF4942 domain-containing protein [Halomonas azerbaijanica]
MTAALKIGEVADTPGEFFAPADTDVVDGLISQYQRDRARIEEVVAFTRPERLGSVLHYFIEGNQDRRDRFTGSVARLFGEDGALAALNADYWGRALGLTDVLDFMPAKRREEWFEAIHKLQTPDFEDATVRATLGELLRQRMDFLAEKVDGIFRALSRTHVTNRPEGFSKRMILSGVTNDWGAYARSQTGHINDLRQVIAKFMSRDEPDWNASNRLVEIARREHRGEWLDVDGGALRIRCYKNGNAHLEVHPDIAWRLNQILAHLHPMAIPGEFRTAPKRKPREYTLMERPLPFAVLKLLGDLKAVRTSPIPGRIGHDALPPVTRNPHSLEFGFGEKDKHALAEAEKVLAAIGGVKCRHNHSRWWEFDYDASPIINEVVCSGVIPEQKSHQFYPTPPGLANKAAELAEIQPHHNCLEPSAGSGNIADMIPQSVCIEVSKLHCQVLEAKGCNVIEADFLQWAERAMGLCTRFDRIVMNPPYSQGRWQAHTEAAATLLAPGGRLVAILPSSAQSTFHLPGLACRWDGPHDNQFAGASVSVSILIADKE